MIPVSSVGRFLFAAPTGPIRYPSKPAISHDKPALMVARGRPSRPEIPILSTAWVGLAPRSTPSSRTARSRFPPPKIGLMGRSGKVIWREGTVLWREGTPLCPEKRRLSSRGSRSHRSTRSIPSTDKMRPCGDQRRSVHPTNLVGAGHGSRSPERHARLPRGTRSTDAVGKVAPHAVRARRSPRTGPP